MFSAALAWAWLGYIATAGIAQDPILRSSYGSGVHEYFSGGYRQAIADLTEAVDGGTKDPRVFYFRALFLGRLGDMSKAQTDQRRAPKWKAPTLINITP